MSTRFDLLYALALPGVLPYLAARRLRGKYGESAGGMLGRRLPSGEAARPFADGSLWIHAVSVGEVAAAGAVAPGLRELAPGLPLVVSTVTETGQAAARRAFPADTTTYFPLDISSNVHRFQEVFRPRIFVVMETELWPNFLMLAAARGTRCFMLNAKLSDRSFPRYRRFKGVLTPALSALRGVCTQTADGARRFAELGIEPSRIRATGNCKFDLNQPPLVEPARAELLAELGMNPRRRWIVAGSTHPGEEKIMLDALAALRARVPEIGLLLCPRHPERFTEVARLVAAAGWRTGRASAPAADADPEVVVLDRMGVLARAYGLGEAAIVAGSFCPVGGHNLLEPAVHRVPVLFGPDMHSQREIDRLFKEAGAGIQVEPADLAPALERLLVDPAARRAAGEKAHAALAQNQGSAARAVAAIGEWLAIDGY